MEKAGSPLSKSTIYNIKRHDARKTVRSVQRQQRVIERIELHQEIMRASDRDTNFFYRLNQRSTSSQFNQVLQAND